MARPTKYDTVIVPRMDWIKEQARQGLPENEIYSALGVSKQTWVHYKNEHKELFDLFDLLKEDSERQKAIEERCNQVKDALFRRAMGIEYDEVEEYITESGNKKTVHKKKVRKYFPPDTAAAKSYLNIFDKNYANDRANMEIRKREVAVKEKLANMAEDSEDKVININIT